MTIPYGIHICKHGMMHTWYSTIRLHTRFSLHEETYLFKMSIVLCEEQRFLIHAIARVCHNSFSWMLE
jgi:hypothetical protein